MRDECQQTERKKGKQALESLRKCQSDNLLNHLNTKWREYIYIWGYKIILYYYLIINYKLLYIKCLLRKFDCNEFTNFKSHNKFFWLSENIIFLILRSYSNRLFRRVVQFK